MSEKSSARARIGFFGVLCALTAVSFVLAQEPFRNADHGWRDSAATTDLRVPDTIEGRYIVALHETRGGEAAQDRLVRRVEKLGGTVHSRFTTVLNGGFTATLPAPAVEVLQNSPHVAYLEPDFPLYAYPAAAELSNVGAACAEAMAGGGEAIAECRSWGVDRMNQRNLPRDGNSDFYGTGAGTHVYVIGTGLQYSCFQGQATDFYDFDPSNLGEDCNGNGTRVGGVVYQIATQASYYSVRVLNCMGAGNFSNIIAGLDAIATNGNKPGVAVLGFGGFSSVAVEDSLNYLVAAGYPVVAPAGHASSDACYASPARVPDVIVAAATNLSGSRTPWSDYGVCVDVFAPGDRIETFDLDCACVTSSGNQLAAAHVAGGVAVHLGKGACDSAESCQRRIQDDATPGAVSNPGPGSPNLLLYVP